MTLKGLDVLANWRNYDLEDEIYLPNGVELTPGAEVHVFSVDPMRKRNFEESKYFLGIEQVRDVVEGLEGQLGRMATPRNVFEPWLTMRRTMRSSIREMLLINHDH